VETTLGADALANLAVKRIVHQLRNAVLIGGGVSLSDGELLTCFLTQGDEAAFAALLKRYGPLVLGVCQRILRNRHDAEDAFQARKARNPRKARK
jgi:hypothetical protein